MAAPRTKLLVLAFAAFVLVLALALVTVLTLLRPRSAPGGSGGATIPTGDARRPAAGSPRGMMWDVWHAAMRGDRDAVRAAFHASGEAEERAADAMAELLL